jgi:hypothetical protein
LRIEGAICVPDPEETKAMNTVIEALRSVRIGEPRSYRNFTMFPLIATGGGGEPLYRNLDQVLHEGTLRIREVSAEGYVPELLLDNRGDKPVLLLDGEELIGCKQNRVLNVTVLAPAHSTIKIPVSCVEQGRWSPLSEVFSAAPQTQYYTGRARKVAQVSESLNARGRFHADQLRVWEELSSKQARMGARSRTAAMADLYAARDSELKQYTGNFKAEANQVGALFSINGKLVGLELFDSAESLAAYLPKVVSGYALDAIEYFTAVHPVAEDEQARTFLSEIETADIRSFPGVALGRSLRLKSDKDVVGAALEHEHRIMHLCAFRLMPETHDIATRTSRRRPSSQWSDPGRMVNLRERQE